MQNESNPQLSQIIQPGNRNPYVTAEPLPPAPMMMVPPPPSDMRADDGTTSFPMVLEDDGSHGWVVFDKAGMCVELFLFQAATEPSRVDVQALALFERRRCVLGDEAFADANPTETMEQAEERPEGDVGHVLVHYDGVTPAPDGTRTVLVSLNQVPLAALAIDADGDVVDGACEPDELTPYAEELIWNFAERRLAADDPWFLDMRRAEREAGERS